MNKVFMKILTHTFVTATLLFFTYSINAQNSWVGEYTLVESNDKQISGPEIYVPVRISITTEDGKLMAHLYGKSGNIAIDIYANVVEKGDKITLLYREVGNYHTWKKRFRNNDLLLSLERTDSAPPNNILTWWGEFSPITEDRVESGKPYFRKLSPKYDDWVRIETDDKKFSVLFPKDFLVHAGKNPNRSLRAFGYKNGVEMFFSVGKKKAALPPLVKSSGQALFGNARRLKIGDWEVLWTNAKFRTKYNDSILLQDDNRTYVILVSADTPRKPSLRTFISGILIDGNPLVKNMPAPVKVKKRHLVSELRTSPEVKEALSRKRVKTKRKIIYKPLRTTVYGDSPDLFSRGAFKVRGWALGLGWRATASKRVLIQMELLANGQVGDMTVYYSGSQKNARRCADLHKTVKFVPAQVNGRPVNSVRVGMCGRSGLYR